MIDWVLKMLLAASSHLFIVITWPTSHTTQTLQKRKYNGTRCKIIAGTPLLTPHGDLWLQSQLHFHTRILQGQLNNRVQHHPEDTREKNPVVITKTFDHSWATVKINMKFMGTRTSREVQCFLVNGSNKSAWLNCC